MGGIQRFFYKLFLGKPEYNVPLKHTVYFNYRRNFFRIWNNANHHDAGFEKLLRLFLVAIHIIFPGIHVMFLVGKRGIVSRNMAKECYVVFKTFLPLYFMMSGLYHQKWVIYLSAYLLGETIFYVASLIFVSDMFVKPRSYRRNMLMLFFNYVEICLCFAVIYAGFDMLDGRIFGPIDYIYFSIITATTIGYGDIHPATSLAKIATCFQALISVAFVGLFLNFFGSKMETMHNEDEV